MSPLTSPIPLQGWQHSYSGKVRDLYLPTLSPDAAASPTGANDARYLLVLASDRVSAFDVLLDPPILGKGALLTALSTWWFSKITLPNHLVTVETAAADGVPPVPVEVADRATLTKRLRMHPIECVVRGALTGSAYREYRETGTVCGVRLPTGLRDGDLLDRPLYTPAYKAPQGQHDENITFDGSVELVGGEVASALRDASLKVFAEAGEYAQHRGLVLADTKFEFGWDPHSGSPAQLLLADELLTSDSSRYWDAAAYAQERAPRERRLASFDKQIVRDWLAANWNQRGKPPPLPADVIARTLARYRELYQRLTAALPGEHAVTR